MSNRIETISIITGLSIERLCEIVANDLEPDDNLGDRTSMVRAARSLLNSVTRVLLLADIVVVKQLLLSKDKVFAWRLFNVETREKQPYMEFNGLADAIQFNSLISIVKTLYFQMPKTLSRLESVANFTEFVKAFSIFGAEMVELAHVTCKCVVAVLNAVRIDFKMLLSVPIYNYRKNK